MGDAVFAMTGPPPSVASGRAAEAGVAVATTAALPPCAAALLERGDPLADTADWYDTVVEAAMPAESAPDFLCLAIAGEAGVLLPLRRTGHRLDSLTTPYSCQWRPLGSVSPRGWRRAGRAYARHAARGGVARLEAIDPTEGWVDGFLAGAARGGMVPLRFDHFANWQEMLDGRDAAAYLADRPGVLRSTIRRRLRDPALRLELVTGGAALGPGIAAFEDIHARSWKVAEPFPQFIPTLMRRMAARGALRLGLLRDGDAVLAAQFWVVADGTATVLKLAHDEAARARSPGTVLTALMLRRLIDADRPARLDFGRGDDPYKSLWTTTRRQRIGVVLANPLHPAGARAIARHAVGRLRQRLRG